jgi:hypothetical protein
MLNSLSRMWLIGGWLATVALIVGWSVAVGASVSTSAMLLVICVAPAVVMLLLGGGAQSPTVAEILHPANTKDGRR